MKWCILGTKHSHAWQLGAFLFPPTPFASPWPAPYRPPKQKCCTTKVLPPLPTLSGIDTDFCIPLTTNFDLLRIPLLPRGLRRQIICCRLKRRDRQTLARYIAILSTFSTSWTVEARQMEHRSSLQSRRRPWRPRRGQSNNNPINTGGAFSSFLGAKKLDFLGRQTGLSKAFR